jgi:magnesium transporter
MAPLPRPRLEEYSTHLYITMQLPIFRRGEPGRDGICLLIGQGYVISFFKTDSAIYRSIRERLLNGQGRIRQMGADYLLISLLNEAIERSFPVIELIESGIEDLESEIIDAPSHDNLERILEAKRAISSLRHYVWPAAEAITSLSRLRSPLIGPKVRVFLRDIADHGMHLTNLVNTLRDMVAGLLDIYHSASSASLNKVMKVLTMISTIFIPLTFLAGLEGMNIRSMPELDWPATYPFLLGLMLSIAMGMLIFFKRKKWF